MAVKALKRMAPFWYTPQDERDEKGDPKPDATRFKIRGLSGEQQGYVYPELQVDEAKRVPTGMTGKGLELALSYGLLDWERFSDEEGKPVGFSPGNFARLPHEIRVELAMAILASSHVDLEEKKT